MRWSDGAYWFDLTENSFMRDLVWRQYTDASVSNSETGQTQFQIVLTKWFVVASVLRRASARVLPLTSAPTGVY